MNRFKSILAALTAVFATIAGLDVTGIVALLPPEVAKWGVIIPSAAAAVVHLLESLGKSIDGNAVKLIVLAFAASCLLPSCQITLDPTSGRFGVATDPEAVIRLTERITRKANDELDKLPSITVTPAK